METLSKTELRLVRSRNTDRDGRPCDAMTTARQIGRTTFAVSGGRVCTVEDKHGDEVGVILPMGDRAVEVILNWLDLYTVRRVRLVTRGAHMGQVVVEHETNDVYCDDLPEVVYTASCWR